MKPLERAEAFCAAYGLRVPILMAPMAGACPPGLAVAVARAGGMGACGAVTLSPEEITAWAAELRAATNGAFQLNTWIPDGPVTLDPAQEAGLRRFLADWTDDLPETVDGDGPDFAATCEAMLAAGPAVISSIMGVYPPKIVARMKERGIHWFATATTVAEAVEAEAAGADVIVAQGMEAGGHRGAFDPGDAEAAMVGLFSLVPAVVDAVSVPVVATGGIADARGVAAALMLGASAVQIGTGLLRSTEAGIAPSWAEAIGAARPEDTVPTRALSGRLGRSLRTGYVEAARSGPAPAPYPIQGDLVGAMRKQAAATDDLSRMSAWAGQSGGLAQAASATDIVTDLWDAAQAMLGVER